MLSAAVILNSELGFLSGIEVVFKGSDAGVVLSSKTTSGSGSGFDSETFWGSGIIGFSFTGIGFETVLRSGARIKNFFFYFLHLLR